MSFGSCNGGGDIRLFDEINAGPGMEKTIFNRLEGCGDGWATAGSVEIVC